MGGAGGVGAGGVGAGGAMPLRPPSDPSCTGILHASKNRALKKYARRDTRPTPPTPLRPCLYWNPSRITPTGPQDLCSTTTTERYATHPADPPPTLPRGPSSTRACLPFLRPFELSDLVRGPLSPPSSNLSVLKSMCNIVTGAAPEVQASPQ